MEHHGKTAGELELLLELLEREGHFPLLPLMSLLQLPLQQSLLLPLPPPLPLQPL